MSRAGVPQQRACQSSSRTPTGRISGAAGWVTDDIVDFWIEVRAWRVLEVKGYTALFTDFRDMLKQAEQGDLLAQTLKVWYDIELVKARLTL